MYLGKLEPILKRSEELLNKNFKENQILSFEDIMKPYLESSKLFDETEKEIFYDLYMRYFQKKYIFTSKLNLSEGENSFRQWDQKCECDETLPETIKIPKNLKKLEKTFQKLWNTPQPEQRTKEWFDFRYNRITASDTAAALDENPYEPVESFILKKCDPNFPFRDNKFCHHGKKYEPTATQIYEHIYNNKVTEFGCIASEKRKIVGASPDGICSKFTLNNSLSDRVGVMLEIKCVYPTGRRINIKGKIDGNICPHYYFCQVQQQLECCELKECDFWQCRLIEYESREKYLADPVDDTHHYEGNEGEEININNKIKKGCILQFLPNEFEPEFEGEEKVWKSKYIYPPRLDMDKDEYNDWILECISNWRKMDETQEWQEKYHFDRIIYWKLEKSINVTIKRDKKWFKERYPILENTWKQVEYYRLNPEKMDEIQVVADKRKKWFKLSTKINISSEDLVKKNMLILDEEEEKSDSDEDCDFI